MTYFKFALIILVAIILQLSIVEQFINVSYYLNLPLLVIIFYNWLSPNRAMLFFTVFMGWGQSYFDALPFGLTILTFVVTAAVIQKLSLTYLTNKTLGSLTISGILGVIIYIALLTLISLAKYRISINFVILYILSVSTVSMHILIAALLVILIKLTIFRHEVPQT